MFLCAFYVILYATCSFGYQNLALRKPAWQRKNYLAAFPWGADKAVDGKYTDRRALGNQCTISADKQQTAEWRVDLQGVVSISYINIFYRMDDQQSPSSYVERFAGFSLFVSNTTSKEDGHLCFHEIQTVSGTPVEDQRINCSVYGRYVIYYNERKTGVTYPSYYSQYAFNELCELEVHGCPVPGYFGQNCNRLCPEKCREQQCDAVTGYCVNGCLSGYHGVHCSYANLALRKPAWQQYPYSNTSWGADKAVDGLYTSRGVGGNQCTLSANGKQTAELRVDLQRVVSISHINIFYRTENTQYLEYFSVRFAGFLVYVSNTTAKDDGYLCLHEIQKVNGRPAEDQSINCSVHGRYVIYYNERRTNITYPNYYSKYAFNEVCELEVFGCLDARFFGQNCEQLCPDNCQEQRCHIYSGECLGCIPGYKGLQCNKDCGTQTYGLECSESCGYCNNTETCHHVNGTCVNGCNEGYKGDKCKTACQPGTYGKNCVHVCNVTCGVTSRCDRFTGKCEGGCQPGWKGDKCGQKCDGRMYGINCTEACGHCLDDDQCHHINGTCLRGCSTGYKGQLCKTECDGGMYGFNCSDECGNCFNETQCHFFKGTCLNGCSEGYKGDFCTDECDGGMFGVNCSQRCGNCLNDTQCHHINGTCLEGCSTGYKRFLCVEECDNGMYGENCGTVCGHCLNETQCHHINGSCEGGCSVGYKGHLCDKECDNRTFGDKCNETCGNCINDTQCHHVSGECMEGCSSGFDGRLCVDSCSDESPESTSCSKSPEKLEEEGGSSSVPLIGGVVAAGIVLAIVVLAAILIIRSRNAKGTDQQRMVGNADRENSTSNVQSSSKQSTSNFTNIYINTEETTKFMEKNVAKLTPGKGQQSSEREDEIDSDEKIHEENPYGDLYINEETVPDIEIEELENVIKEKSKNEDDGFKREYATMPYGEKYPCNAGKQPENVPKNRFKTTFPYDHSRIKLSDSQSDYINANFIDGIDKTNQYIAAQGPRQNTIKDFWTMIWQENVDQIIILTNLKEGNKAKCSKYWPDLYQSTTFGVISLLAEEEHIYANYRIRKFRVTHKVHKRSRIVSQYHYTAWPDHGIPEPLCLVVFHDHVTRTTEQQNTGPKLVHCSAGIGRTGTYVALDALFKAGKSERKVNIAEYVKKMREGRMNMVQTYEQYKTIFLALEAVFKAPTCVLTKPEFTRKAELMILDKPANESDLRKEFQNLLRVRPRYTEAAYKFAIESSGSKLGVLPLDKYRLFLSSSVPKRGNYINAITLHSYTKNKAFIITPYPQVEDAVDFLRLLTDHESDVVICMDPLTKVESTKMWLPAANSKKSVFPFTVNCGEEQVTDIKFSTINIIQDGANDEGCSVSIIEPTGSLKIVENSQATTQMLHLVSAALQSKTEGPITVVSSDGAALCGVFCSVFNTLQQLSMDGEVDIFTAVRQLQIRRPELCSTLEEYMMIYNVVLDYIQAQEETSEENIYSNQ